MTVFYPSMVKGHLHHILDFVKNLQPVGVAAGQGVHYYYMIEAIASV